LFFLLQLCSSQQRRKSAADQVSSPNVTIVFIHHVFLTFFLFCYYCHHHLNVDFFYAYTVIWRSLNLFCWINEWRKKVVFGNFLAIFGSILSHSFEFWAIFGHFWSMMKFFNQIWKRKKKIHHFLNTFRLLFIHNQGKLSLFFERKTWMTSALWICLCTQMMNLGCPTIFERHLFLS
jgi:hypothetical protein